MPNSSPAEPYMTAQMLNARYIGVYLTTVFSGAYLTKLGISPVYPLMGMGMLLLGSLICTGRVDGSGGFWGSFAFVVGLLTAFCVHQNSVGASIQNVVNFILGPVSFFLILGAGRALGRPHLRKISRSFVYFTILIAAIECAYRLTHPDFAFLEGAEERNVDIDEVAFYAYKFSSLMYLDSNFVGLQLAIVLSFCLAVKRFGIHFKPVVYIALGILVVLTLSRASMLASCAAVAIWWFYQMGRWTKVIAIATAVIAVQLVFIKIHMDGSFLTKLELLNQFSIHLSNAKPAVLLFGAGVGNAALVLGMGAHNLLVTYGVELGIVMSSLIFLFWASVCVIERSTVFLIVVWVVNGFSLTSFAIPYMYCAAAVLCCLAKSEHLCQYKSSSGVSEN